MFVVFISASFPKYNRVNDSQFVNLIIFFTQLNSITIISSGSRNFKTGGGGGGGGPGRGGFLVLVFFLCPLQKSVFVFRRVK